MIKTLRILGWLEGCSFLLMLIVAMPLKYIWGNPLGVKMLGMPHGLLFLAYIFLALYVADDKGWSWKVRAYAIFAAIVPFGTFVFERKYLQ